MALRSVLLGVGCLVVLGLGVALLMAPGGPDNDGSVDSDSASVVSREEHEMVQKRLEESQAQLAQLEEERTTSSERSAELETEVASLSEEIAGYREKEAKEKEAREATSLPVAFGARDVPVICVIRDSPLTPRDGSQDLLRTVLGSYSTHFKNSDGFTTIAPPRRDCPLTGRASRLAYHRACYPDLNQAERRRARHTARSRAHQVGPALPRQHTLDARPFSALRCSREASVRR